MKQKQEKILFGSAIDRIYSENISGVCSGVSGSEKAYLVSKICQRHQRPVCVVAATPADGRRFVEDLQFYSRDTAAKALCFWPYTLLPFKFLSYHNETAAGRIRTLYRLIENRQPCLVITTVGALLQKIIPRQEISGYAELVLEGEDLERDHLIDKLIAGGYQRASVVEEPGDFCVRGGIIDVYTPLYAEPLRIELFGDSVDSLRFFSPVSQRTTRRISEAVILPAREVILKQTHLPDFIGRVRKAAAKSGMPVTKLRTYVRRIKDEGGFPGIGSLGPLVYETPATLFDYIPDPCLYVLDEPGALERAALELERQAIDNYAAAVKEGRLCVEPDILYMPWGCAKTRLTARRSLTFRMLPFSAGDGSVPEPGVRLHLTVGTNENLCVALKQQRDQDNPLSPLATQIDDHRRSGLAVLLICSGSARVNRLMSLLSPYGIRPGMIREIDGLKPVPGNVYICDGQVSNGFVWAGGALAVISEKEIFGTRRRRTQRSETAAPAQFIPYEDLKQGDHIVHADHGIGRYEGLVKLSLNGTQNDFILICYRDDDKLYLPVDRMSMVQKYMGVDGITPVLDKMGGVSWDRVRQKVKKSVEKIAGELLKIYAERKVRKGNAFSDTDDHFRDFEAGFAFEETADQARAIEAVLEDMRKPLPMDRLICGDVGYGKTEVALRASFVAVNDGKQVAMLVPTTVLAEQHYATFCSRYENYPVRIDCLSRFRSPQEQRRIVNDLKTGRVDIVIGTHRLLQKDIHFKDIGLVILDEEQRFGVRHKEKLKRLRSNVDVLALTATPIPRTLYLSLTGIRDITTISTPPEHRRPIITFISEFDDAVIVDAVRTELRRGGQLFFVHNNIATIEKIAGALKRLVPEVRLDVAHGRLDEEALERVMFKFVNREIDMLVCTTIIESGLDIPSVNTIIVNRADRFGLAQMYQLRGRVGRGDEQAYAYLFIPKESGLGRDAQKRLKVLMEHSDLGSGFQIAMSDLRIRGGGTILGSSQSGHIAAVGYDMFLKLMENAIATLKGETVYEPLEPEINVRLSAYIPESYIPDIDQRLSAYRRLSRMTELRALADFKAELTDRYGLLPPETAHLFLKIMLRALSIQAGIKRLDLQDHQMSLFFSEAHQKHPTGLVDLTAANADRFKLAPDGVLTVRLHPRNVNGMMAEVKNILKEITQHVNG